MVTLTHSTIQDGWTALKQASSKGHHKVVELLLRAGANLDLQDKVRTVQDSGVHVNLINGRWYVLHPVKPGTIVNLFPSILLGVHDMQQASHKAKPDDYKHAVKEWNYQLKHVQERLKGLHGTLSFGSV